MDLRSLILDSEDIPSEELEIPEWGVTILVKGMSAGERITLMQNAYDPNTQQVNMAAVYPDVLVACVYNPETGEAVFTNDDKQAIMAKSSAAVEKIASVGLRLSGIGKDEEDASGKGFSSTPSEGSSSS